MKKIIFLATFCLVTFSVCSTDQYAWSRGRSRVVEPVPQQPQMPPEVPQNSSGGILFTPVKGTIKQIERVHRGEVLVNKIIASQCFEDYFLNRALIQTGNRTNAEVVAHIRSLRLKVPVVYYYNRWSGVVGYRQPPSDTIYVNDYFHQNYSDCSEASGNGHEMLHVANYDHDFNPTARRPYSVPYSWNAMVMYCCSRISVK